MTTQAMLDGPALFKQDSVRRIDGLINYFGEATTADNSHDGSTAPDASGDLQSPSPSFLDCS